MIGIVGHILLLLAFVATLLSGAAYFWAARDNAPNEREWVRIGNALWVVMTVATIVVSILMLVLSFGHRFDYAYIYQTTSRDLHPKFLFSSLWAGQEGSFLLWIIFSAITGITAFLWVPKTYRAPVMAVMALCQAFLISMIVGIQIGPIKIGSDPFMLLKDRFPDAPMLQVPGFVPADGNGLNDLLKNPWMVIHPPTLFVGFTLMLVPFSFAVAALWKRKYSEWIRPAMPWMALALGVLGLGIMMGGYWAYVTLSFGGYWAWDPVENSSLVPWLIGVAAMHAMLVQRKSGGAHKAALLLSILAFIFTVYSTFLTRSGILGDISVHSFVDLGLSGQLLIWICVMAIVGLGLFAWRYRELPTPDKEPPYLSREFLIFSGAMVIAGLAAVVILGTSAPILGRLFRENPSAVPISFYNEWSLPISILFVLLLSLGQLFWWHKMTVAQINKVVFKPLALSVFSTLLFLPAFVALGSRPRLEAPSMEVVTANFLGQLGEGWAQYGYPLQLLLLVLVSFFALYSNVTVLWRIGRGNARLVGGSLAHIGVAIFLLGVIASSGFNRPLSRTGVLMGADRDNFVLTSGETRRVGGYTVTYSGREKTEEGYDRFLIDFESSRGQTFQMRPVVYESTTMQWIQHPDVRMWFFKDLYVAVSPAAMFELPDDASAETGEVELTPGQTVKLGDDDYRIRFIRYDPVVPAELLPENTEVAVAAELEVTEVATGNVETVRPIFGVDADNRPFYLQARVAQWNLTTTFVRMDPTTEALTLGIEGVKVMPEDWVVVQAYEKPFINLVWLGTILITLGFGFAYYRRWYDLHYARSGKEDEG